MKNYFYANQITDRIRQLLDENLAEDAVKNIYTGDLSVLPEPQLFDAYLPAVVISTDSIENEYANEPMGLLYQPYSFTVYCIYPYSFEGDNNAVRQGQELAQSVANVLMNYKTLDGFAIAQTEDEAGGLIVFSAVTGIKFDNAEQEIFRMLEIPVHIASISYTAGFRTYRERM